MSMMFRMAAGILILSVTSRITMFQDPAQGKTDYPSSTKETSGIQNVNPDLEDELENEWWWTGDERENDPTIPDDIEEAAYIYGRMFDLSPELLEAICYEETGGTYREDLIDKTGLCYGPMQIQIKAQEDRIAAYGLEAEDMLTADGAMLVAASYLAELRETYEDMVVVLMKYNGASTALKKYRETGELNAYTRHVLNRMKKLLEQHGTKDSLT